MNKVEQYASFEKQALDLRCAEPFDWEAHDKVSVVLDELWTGMSDAERQEAGVPRVECAVCGKDHGRGISSTQAQGCASRIAFGADGTLYLTCHFESALDGDAYEVLVELAEADPVCDACVHKYKDAGMLRLVGDYLHDKDVVARVFKP